jgi:hypothetical protein
MPIDSPKVRRLDKQGRPAMRANGLKRRLPGWLKKVAQPGC